MRAGKLRHRLTITTPTFTTNTYGEKEQTGTTTSVVWGSVEPLTGRERFEGQQVIAGLSHKITIRADATIAERDYIAFDSRTFQIDAILKTNEVTHEMVILAKEEK